MSARNTVAIACAAGAGCVATVIAIAACSSYGEANSSDVAAVDSSVDGNSIDGGSNTSSQDTGQPITTTTSCDAGSTQNLATCDCATEGATNTCFQGVPGAASACNVPGGQSCLKSQSGHLQWGACVGGALPKDAEACDNSLDDNCDGRIDEGCACSGQNLCVTEAGMMLPETEYTIFTIPTAPKANVKFDLYVITKANVLNGPGLARDTAFCYGAGLIKPCASTGPQCVGWKVARFAGLTESAGTHTYSIFDPNGDPPCSGLKIAEKTIPIVP